jgi:hypothetical protein
MWLLPVFPISWQESLAVFFGRRDLNEALLPLIITCLNATGEWQLRSRFFQVGEGS